MNVKCFQLIRSKSLILLATLFFNLGYGNNNKLFWDGSDWNRVKKRSEYNINTEFIIKKAYLEGALDGRLFSYLKTWSQDQSIADDIFSETVDYLTLRELIKNIDHFYNDPLNNYIPIPSAIIIANMYAKRMNSENVDAYIRSTREWINSLNLDLDSLNYSEILKQKSIKYNKN
tara:strand:- start:1655 stop:2176 length:522 start_codon:yes stop_codon:yes gene_type:complete